MDASIYDRVKFFDKPFVYILINQKSETYCAYCLRKPMQNEQKLQLCGNCRFARYCNKNCQRQAWKEHKSECGRLKNIFPHLPVTEVLFLARIVDKLAFMEKNGDIQDWQKDRKFDDLLTHENDIRNCQLHMNHFEKIYEKISKFLANDTPEKEKFFLIFCRSSINCHGIHSNVGDEIGMALDLGVSRYDHCCRPNVTLVFNGFRAMLRPLVPNVDAKDYRKSFISYVDVGRSKYLRRKELYAKWFFWCQCERCSDPDDDKLTSIKCSNKKCPEPIVITEESEPIDITCSKCSSVIKKDDVIKSQNLMKTMPTKFNMDASEEEIKSYKQLFIKAQEILHSENIYYCRLMTAYLQVSRGEDEALTNSEMQKMVYQNYRRCLPQSDRHIGYQLLHLVKTLIEKGQRSEAVEYAYEAMAIFEVCFGLEHPYYLQTLALWTYLDTKAKKSDDELLQLMNFNYNRPVDLTSILASPIA